MNLNKDLFIGMVTGVAGVIALWLGLSYGHAEINNMGELPEPIAANLRTGQLITEPTEHKQLTRPITTGRKRMHLSKSVDTIDRVVEAIIYVESRGNRKALGGANERGLMQIKYQTWQLVCKNLLGKDIPWSWAYNEEYNKLVGTAYLKYCLKKSRGDWDWAIIRYNRGHNYKGNYRRYLYRVKARLR